MTGITLTRLLNIQLSTINILSVMFWSCGFSVMAEYFVSYALELWIFCNGGIFCQLCTGVVDFL